MYYINLQMIQVNALFFNQTAGFFDHQYLCKEAIFFCIKIVIQEI